MSQRISVALVFAVLVGSLANAAGPSAPGASGGTSSGATTATGTNSAAGQKHAGPCAQIESDCKSNGYVAGEAGQGKGLWWDCMCPLIAQGFPEPSANVLKVPSDGNLVSACRQHPHGQKIMANCANMLAKKNAKQAAKSNGSTGH